jgi:FkbM family methyltransferase
MPNPHPNTFASRAIAYATHPQWITRRIAWEVLRRTRHSVTISTPQGQFRIRTANRVIGTQLYTRRVYEAGIISNAMNALSDSGHSPKNRTIIDIGANIGMSSIALVLGGYCRNTVAIEPEVGNFTDLLDNVRRNGLSDRISCYQFAASHRDGTLLMELADVNFGDHRVRVSDASSGVYGESERQTAQVPARPLDEFCQTLTGQDIACLWIDVQGYDAYVLKGARALVARGTPVVTEFWPYGMRRAGVTPASYTTLLGELFSSCVVVRETERSAPRRVAEALPPLFEEIGDGVADLTLVLLP